MGHSKGDWHARRGVMGAALAGIMSACSLAVDTDGLACRGDSCLAAPEVGGPSTAAAADGGAADDYNELSTTSSWSLFDLTSLHPDAKGFIGAAFDGRFLYFAPYADGGGRFVARFDTQSPLDDAQAWKFFDLGVLGPGLSGYVGAVFDKRYVYLVPYENDGAHGRMVRYDTLGEFGTSASWSVFDIMSVSANARGFVGGSFDGRYLYLAPYANGGSGTAVRFDTAAPFVSASSWSTFDLASLASGARGYQGSLFDGRYVYFVPHRNGLTTHHGIAVRYDTLADWGASSGWSTFDISTLSSAARGFIGGAFDGRYVYFTPFKNDLGPQGNVARFDTRAGFSDRSAWSIFELTSVHAVATGFQGAVFDGRHVYFVPDDNDASGGLVMRLDTSASFGDRSAWKTFDMTSLHARARGFQSAVFDGKYVYFVPCGKPQSGLVVRFDAKKTRWMPTGFAGSFM